MVSQAAKELFALFNMACGGFLFLVLLAYLAFARQRRGVIAGILLLAVFLCALNSLLIYLLA